MESSPTRLGHGLPPGKPAWVIYQSKHGVMTLSIIPFVLLQLSVLLAFTTYFSWTGLAVCAASFLVRMFAITGFYHRYFSHRTFRMGRAMQFAAAFLGATAAQKGALWWAAHHRRHHKSSDKEDDPHSAREGFWHAHIAWFLYRENSAIDYSLIEDLGRFPELRWLEKIWFVPPLCLGVGLFLLGGWHWTAWGFFVSTFLVGNATYCVNSVMHCLGKQYFLTGDDSRNHWFMALLTLGEGWHNNHHRYQASARNGFYWYELDITYYILRLMNALGLVRDLTPVPRKILQEGKLNHQRARAARRVGKDFEPTRVWRDQILDGYGKTLPEPGKG